MKKLLLTLGAVLLVMCGNAQTTLLFENFEGMASSFTLNTADEGSLSAASSENQWTINNAYSGGAGTDTDCSFGDLFAQDVPAQPAGISSPNNNYMHMHSDKGVSFCFTLNANVMEADATCGGNNSSFTSMSSDISTIGYADVTLTFWWLGEGSAMSYGELYYSIDGGSSWTQITSPTDKYYAQTSWVEQTVVDAAFDDQATLRFGFKYNNELDPPGYNNKIGFSIDDFKIVGTESACTNTYSTMNIDACESYTVPSGDETYTTSGTFNDTIPNAEGCDSIMTITINVDSVNANITSTGSYNENLYSLDSSAGTTYQWFDCVDDAIIVGETLQSYYAAFSGEFAVIVTNGVCVDTSECVFVNWESIEENSLGTSVTVFPNPTDGIVAVVLGTNFDEIEVLLMDVSGRRINRKSYYNVQRIDDIAIDGEPGIYVLQLTAANGKRAVLQLIKE